MSKVLTDTKEMELIYQTAKKVFDGKCSRKYAVSHLTGAVNASESSLIMYIHIFSCMRKGCCYKMGTSESFTLFLLDSIFRDYGLEAYVKALSAVKSNYVYRESVNNSQPGLLRACRQSIENNGQTIIMDNIPIDESSFSENDGASSVAMSPLRKEEYGKVNSASEEKTIKSITNDTIELNIQPEASIMNVFSRLSYKPWYAIAEFVDNSTQSYISNIEKLNNLADFEKLVVKVKYNHATNSLRITDNAYGMELEKFRDAIVLDSRNATQTGRNEFGMGLKTAASWFGNIWSVTSTQLGSQNQYSATIDIPSLKEFGLNSVKVHRGTVDKSVHGTEILISDVTKRITGTRTVMKIRDLLSSMYRRDINNRHIEIWFNDEPIFFEEYPILTNFRGKSWKKELSFEVPFQGKKYSVTGFVAIMNPGSFPKAGFALFRQDRVIIGGTDSNYKPTQIFGQAQSQKSLKLFGELNMNDFPVNQAKDGFIWDDGLEEQFVDALKENIQDYIEIADMSIKARADESQYSDEISQKLQKDVEDTIQNIFVAEKKEKFQDDEEIGEQLSVFEGASSKKNDATSDVEVYVDTVLNAATEEATVGTIRTYNVPINSVSSVHFNVQWAVGSKAFWIDYFEKALNVIDVKINIDHPFFMPYSKDENFKHILEKFALAFILAEKQAKLQSDKNGYILASLIKNNMNRYLEKMAEE